MTTHIGACTRRGNAPPYYQGRPAAFWLAHSRRGQRHGKPPPSPTRSRPPD